MSWDPWRGPVDVGRALRAITCCAWAAFFAYLWISGGVTQYLGPRTHWVVVFGTIALAIASIGQLRFLRTHQPRRLTIGQALGYLLAIAPLAVVFISPGAELGALAASRKLVGEQGTGQIVVPEERFGRPLSFIDFDLGSKSPEYAEAVGIKVGDDVELVGFVTHDADTLQLTRFYISCCAADAIPYSVRIVEADRDYPDDTWLQVEGSVGRESGRYVVYAVDIEEVDEPDPPYLY